ncbi:SAM-dependent methyltransferase [Streptomyces acidiscabies]|uniref:Methyltransferase domain-containing protein n=1 Tax=Streptomyces acidiscabies TaxID=42234 RepID=A0AAP6BI85_9ACTN|nr:methyltransferase domain-containing protein [Streptomyces acidiscabies]MBP5942232.1 methyltransferase domain-containing protein [Streptomyces sp. LBUM 1476]MBZ3913760.1 methyltransferase domain-containing protein [Streptomyces acidiscabies]MDX2965235.1 methyltransferase domain-containing protein [Streptomyces acidiscabies]MDX3022149.1 methyltransferase domain-containing protein [Streptomyces acidiscabies]MDX3795412.1 methyltransferase domain-containing protein [Streptomyces acidiscabies]
MTASGDVGTYYDLLTPLLQQLWGGNFHIGLWPESPPPPDTHTPTDTTADPTDPLASVVEAGDRLTDLLLRELDPHPGRNVLDIGCGIGHPALRLARTTGAQITGITISTSQVRIATDHAARAGLDHLARFQYADATALPFTDHAYNAAWAVESLLHIPDTHRALTEIHRVLAPGSPFVISDMILRAPDRAEHAHSSITPLPELLALLDTTGFRTTRIIDLDDHLSRSLHRLRTDLDRHRTHAGQQHDEAIDALTRILDKILPGIGTVFGYTVITAHTRRPTN